MKMAPHNITNSKSTAERLDSPRHLSRILHDEGSSALAGRELRRLDQPPFDQVSMTNLDRPGQVDFRRSQQLRNEPSIVHICSDQLDTSVLAELREANKRYNRSMQIARQQMSRSRQDGDQNQVQGPGADVDRRPVTSQQPRSIRGDIYRSRSDLLQLQDDRKKKTASEMVGSVQNIQRATAGVDLSNVSDSEIVRRLPSITIPSQFMDLSPADLYGKSTPRRDSTQVRLSHEGPLPDPSLGLVYKRQLAKGQLLFLPSIAPNIDADIGLGKSAESGSFSDTDEVDDGPSSIETHGPLYIASSTSSTQREEAKDQEEEETMPEFKARLTYLLGQMMFVSGETAEPSAETTWMIEEIVREQVLEMLKEATILANRRGSKSISIVDLIFQIRHNTAKVSRLKTFLSWKDVRKNVKDSDDKAGADADALDLEDAAGPGANPAAPQKTTTNKKAKLILPWEAQSFYSEQVPEREDEEDEEEEEQNEATLARLASADERTRNMTRDEYVYWSDCRQASFTFRKGKRFKEWAGFGTIIDSKPNDDVVDILGFLTFEIVQTLTEEALKVKNSEDLRNKKASIGRGEEASKKRKREVCTLFEMPEEGRTPVEPRHVREAFRILQIVPPKYKFMRQGYAGTRTPLRMI